MTGTEFGLFASALRTYFPREKILPNKAAMELWFRELKDLPYAVAEAALRKWVASNRWSPSIADIREMANKVINGEPGDWGDGWKQVTDAIRRHGYYGEEAALESMDNLTRETVRRLGWKSLCLSDNVMTDRANFRMIYDQLQQRSQTDQMIPPDVKKLIGRLQMGLEENNDLHADNTRYLTGPGSHEGGRQ